MMLLQIHEPGETPLPHENEKGLAVGIDLGTTNSVVAIARDGTPAALHDETGRALVPSVAAAVPAWGFVLGGIVYGLAFVHPLRQGLHDRAAGSVVVMHR